MRKFNAIWILMIFATMNVGWADTTPPPPSNGPNWISKTLMIAGGVTVAVVGVGLTVYSVNGLHFQMKAAYVQQFQEDAADYLAGGTASALLSEIISTVRDANTTQGQTATDAEITSDLLAATLQ